MKHKIKHVPVKFIDKGTYVGSEEAVFEMGLNDSAKDYVVIPKEDWEDIVELLNWLE